MHTSLTRLILGVIVGSAVGTRLGASHLRQPAAPEFSDGYGQLVAVGIVLTGLGAIWIAVFWSLWPLVTAGIAWCLFAWLLCAAGFREEHDRRHP